MTGIDASTPPVDHALLPAAVRNGTKEQKQAYGAALSFERTLVNQMTESMMKTASIGGDDSGDDAATKVMKEQIPGNLADAIMGAGGLGLAGQMYTSFEGDSVKATSLSDETPSTPSTPSPGAGQGGATA